MLGAAAETVPEQKLTRKQEILASLNEQQKAPVKDYIGPSVLIAGAGSGKTHCVISRIEYMIEDGISPFSILAFTFTNKAAKEMQGRVADRLGKKADGVTVSTYHSFCVRILRKFIEDLNLAWNRNFCIYDTDDKNEVLRKILSDQKDDSINSLRLAAAQVGSRISKWKENMVSPQMAMQSIDKYEQLLGRLYEQYERAMADSNALDFDDLIYFTIRLFERSPEALKAINFRYRYIIADESQDSSPRDLRLIEFLGGTEMNICLVGDDWQSIYGFRGSDLDAYFNFVEKHKLKQYRLERNYRSTQTIVDAAQSLIVHNTKQFEKTAFSKNKKGTNVVCYTTPDQETEAIFATKVAKVYNREYGIPYEDMAVLYRVSKQARPIEDAFLCNAIPYEKLSGTPFYGLMEIKDILAYLKLLINPMDSVALDRIINVPARGIGEKSKEKLFASCQLPVDSGIISLEDMLDALGEAAQSLSAKPRKGVLNFVSVMKQLSDAAALSTPAEMIDTVRYITDYDKYLKEKEPETYDGRSSNLDELVELAQDSRSLFDFLSGMALNEKVSDEHSSDTGVKLMTIHGSKGLEFKLVIVIGLNEGTLPHSMARSEDAIEEERRLFYVAMTRAKEFLFITRPNIVKVRNTPELAMSSRFLNEIDSQFVKAR